MTGKYYIEAPAKTKKGWKKVPDTAFDTPEKAEAYGNKYHTDKHGSKKFRIGMIKLKEEAPTNSMGNSSSVPGRGPIDTFDPILTRNRVVKRVMTMWKTSKENTNGRRQQHTTS